MLMVGDKTKGLLAISMSVIVLLIISSMIEVPTFIYGQSPTESNRVRKVIVDTHDKLGVLAQKDKFTVVTRASNGSVFNNLTEVIYSPKKGFIGNDFYVYSITRNNITNKTSVSVVVVPE